MLKPRGHRRPVQLEMLPDRSYVPRWPMLPPETKRRIRPLLVRLLKERYVGRLGVSVERGESDE